MNDRLIPPSVSTVALGETLNWLGAGALILDAGKHIRHLNAHACEMLGLAREAALGRQVMESGLLSLDEDALNAMNECLAVHTPWHGRAWLRHHDGEYQDLALHIHPIRDPLDGAGGYLLTLSRSIGLEAHEEALMPRSNVLEPDAALIRKLEHALKRGELRLALQPKVNMRIGRVVGAEALLRWVHPRKGLIPPDAFLPAVEHHPIINRIGEFALRDALAKIAGWRARGLRLTLSVNIAARHLQSPDFVERLHAIAGEFPEHCTEDLEIEILESAAIENTQYVKTVMEACREHGVRFALDDFGTGYASLAYLRKIPADTLKIDRSFVIDLQDDSDNMVLVEGVISLARAFRRNVVAEGVEQPEQGLLLLRMGCDVAQGYGIARPMFEEDFEAWMTAYQPDQNWMRWADVPWQLEDFPLLVAKYDHIGWVKQVIDFLDGVNMQITDHELHDHHQCRFGNWYYQQGMERYSHMPEFIELEDIHLKVHQTGPRIIALHRNGQTPEARRLVGELLDLRDTIVDRLDRLQRAVLVNPSLQNGAKDLPVRAGAAMPLQPLNPVHRVALNTRRPVVLIVEDDKFQHLLMERALCEEFDLRFTLTAEAAIEMLEQPFIPDIILIDITLPGMNGYELCHRIKETPAWRGIPVIFVSVSGQVKEQEAAFRLGAVDFIAKPFQTTLLLARVRIHINLKLRTDFLESQASVDALTGIGNRRYFDHTYRNEWRRSARNLAPMSLLMVDVDHFKQFNDRYGHGAGDDCLRKISAILASSGLRPSDSVTRYGGEEFALILPGCGDGGASTVGNRIRSLVEEAAIPHANSPSTRIVTISVGVATRNPSPVGNMNELLLAADKALYKAKAGGRNQVCCE